MSNDLRSLRGCAAGRPIIFNPSIFRLLHRQIHLLPYITSSQTLFLLFGETFKYFVIDDTVLTKLGRMIENVSFNYDHSLGHTVLGYCIVTLGLFTAHGFYPLDFAYSFGSKRHPKSCPEKIGDPRKSSGKRSFEAKHYTKLDLALMMIQSAVNSGIFAGYVLFDSWYAWPKLIHSICKIKKGIHVICYLKESNVRYLYKGKKYKLSELYQKVKHQLKKDKRTGLLLKRVTVKLAEYDQTVTIIFSKGYC